MPVLSYVANGALRLGTRGDAVIAVQLALRAAGHELVADGDFGQVTLAAVTRFQAAHLLTPDGEVGPLTAKELDRIALRAPRPAPSLPSALSIAPWLSVMRAITGTKEIPGSADNPLILGWVDEIVAAYPELNGTVGWYNDDATPWCGLGCGYAVVKGGYKPPKLLLGAANWANEWPDGIHLREPALGAIMVMTRQGGGHVTMYEGEDAENYYGRGANQSDMVNVARFPKSRNYLGFMWPAAAPPPTGWRVFTTFASAVSATEA
jgi:uncharacterized protein (TIGR02594 family)